MQKGWKTIISKSIRHRPKDKISNKHLFLAYVQSRLNHLNKLYIHCRKIYNLFVRTLETCRKRGFGLFCNGCNFVLFLYLLTICILSLSCNVKQSKITVKLAKKSSNTK